MLVGCCCCWLLLLLVVCCCWSVHNLQQHNNVGGESNSCTSCVLSEIMMKVISSLFLLASSVSGECFFSLAVNHTYFFCFFNKQPLTMPLPPSHASWVLKLAAPLL